MFWKILPLTVVLTGIAIAAIAIKMFVKKGVEFKKQCSSVDPASGQRIGCICDGESGENCVNKSQS